MELIQIRELIEKGKNLIFYDKDVKPCYDELKDDYLCVYFDEPAPARIRLIEIVHKLKKVQNLKRLSVFLSLKNL